MLDMIEDSSEILHRILDLVASEEGLSLARACKRLGLSRSELQRSLTQLGADLGGPDLIRIEVGQGRETLWLTERARSVRKSS